jgi:hypothetical protein
MAGNDRSRLAAARAVDVTQRGSRETIAKQLELARLANERGQITLLSTALTAITTARSADTRT